jgi:hypothetical protein
MSSSRPWETHLEVADFWSLVLWVGGPPALALALLALLLWRTSALARMTSWPWFTFSGGLVVLGATLWWTSGVAWLLALALAAIGFLQRSRRRRRVEISSRGPV